MNEAVRPIDNQADISAPHALRGALPQPILIALGRHPVETLERGSDGGSTVPLLPAAVWKAALRQSGDPDAALYYLVAKHCIDCSAPVERELTHNPEVLGVFEAHRLKAILVQPQQLRAG